MKSTALPIPAYGTDWYTISLASTGVTPAVRAAPSMTRYSLSAWQPMRAASCTISRVRVSSPLCLSTSSKAKLSKTSISSGSVTFSVETRPGFVPPITALPPAPAT
ncbi:MAG: hypothetical protein WA794_08560 [Trebonia sp.]